MDRNEKEELKIKYTKTPTGNLIRVADYYPNPCGTEEYVEVSDAVLEYLAKCQSCSYREHSSDTRNIHPFAFDETLTGEVYGIFEQGADEAYWKRIQAYLLYAAMQKISPQKARRFYLYYAVNLTAKEIAAMEGVSKMAVSKSIRTTRKRLRRLLSELDRNGKAFKVHNWSES